MILARRDELIMQRCTLWRRRKAASARGSYTVVSGIMTAVLPHSKGRRHSQMKKTLNPSLSGIVRWPVNVCGISSVSLRANIERHREAERGER